MRLKPNSDFSLVISMVVSSPGMMEQIDGSKGTEEWTGVTGVAGVTGITGDMGVTG